MSGFPGAINLRRSCRPGFVAGCSAVVMVATLAVTPAGASASLLPPQIHTIVGGGPCSASEASGGPCDGVAESAASIEGARSVVGLGGGAFAYIDSGNDLVREVSSTGVVTTIAGTTVLIDGVSVPDTTDVDGVPATQSGLDDPVAVAALPGGGLLITEYGGDRVRMVSPGPPGQATITTIAGIPPGGSQSGSQTDNVGTSVALNYPSDAVSTADGGVLIADTYNNRIMLLASASAGATIQQIAGGGSACNDAASLCNGMQASQVALDAPDSVAEVPGSGGYLVSEYGADAVREISQEASGGTFTTVVGQPGGPGYSGDGGPASAARLDQPEEVVTTFGGGFLIADAGNNVIREVSSAGLISTIAGNGTLGDTGDGAAATAAQLNAPSAVASTVNNGLLIADDHNDAIREVTLAPVTTIRLSPSKPNGSHGWYKTDPYAFVTTTEDATTSCVLDPGQAPPAFGAISPGCPYLLGTTTITGDGSHTLYAASQNSFGDPENPVSVTFKLDATPPKVTCGKKRTFRRGQRRATVTAVLSNSISGPKKLNLKVRVGTRHPGNHTVKLLGKDRAGVRGSIRCRYRVRS